MTTQSNHSVNALSNLVAQIKEMRAAAKLSPCRCLYHADHRLEVTDAYIAAYTAAGNKAEDLQCSENLSHSMVMMVKNICNVEYWTAHVLTPTNQDRIRSVVNSVMTMTDMIGEPCYGSDAIDTFNAFLVDLEIAEMANETKYAPKG